MKKKLWAELAVGVMMIGMATMAEAAPVQWAVADGGNGHWYDIVIKDSSDMSAGLDTLSNRNKF